MTKITWKIKSLFWFLKRPRLYPELIRKLGTAILSNLSISDSNTQESRSGAKLWCEKRAVIASEAIGKITGSSIGEPLREKFSDIFKEAEEAAKNCPIKMGGAGDLDLLYYLAEYTEANKVIETGVAYGWSSLALLLSLSSRDNGLLISTDMPYYYLSNERYVGCVVPTNLKPRWQIIQEADSQGIPKALEKIQSLDMCHYDSDKSYEGRMWAYPLLWSALRLGGLLISDDIGDNWAFHDFCKQVNQEPIIVRSENKYVGILIKESTDSQNYI